MTIYRALRVLAHNPMYFLLLLENWSEPLKDFQEFFLIESRKELERRLKGTFLKGLSRYVRTKPQNRIFELKTVSSAIFVGIEYPVKHYWCPLVVVGDPQFLPNNREFKDVGEPARTHQERESINKLRFALGGLQCSNP